MPHPALTGIKACVFDAYGTLFDVNAAARHCSAELGERWLPLAELWRGRQLQYTWLRSLMGRHADFWQLTGDALDFAMAQFGIDDPGLRRRLMDLYLQLDAYPEAPGALAALKRAGFKTAILSNGAPRMLQAAVENAGIAGHLDAVLSVEEVGIYKPKPEVYALACERLGVRPEAVAFQSSNAWDAHGASSFGMKVVWINRFNQAAERLPGRPDVELSTLEPLPAVVGAA